MTDPAQTLTSAAYTIDPAHSRLGFTVRHAMITKVHGSFTDFTAQGRLDLANPANSSATVVINAASIDTQNPTRDEHLRTNDFLDVATYPQLRFVATSFEYPQVFTPGASLKITGDLTIKDVTRPVSFDLIFTGSAVDPYQNERVGFEGTLVINRTDWNITWNNPLDAGGVLVGELVTIELALEALTQR